MALDVHLYVFSKRENSTKRPSGDGLKLTCELKEACGIVNPAISILKTSGVNPPLYNYAFIPAFERYYFINEWTWADGLWYASMEVDALASWKTHIGAAKEYVLRSSYDYDTDILDTYYPTKNGVVQETNEASNDPFASALYNGRYVVGIINGDPNAVGAVAYYVFSQGQFNALCDAMMSDTAWLGVDPANLSADVLRAVMNPFQYIVSCMWYPFLVSTGTKITELKFGWWSLPITCSRLSNDQTYAVNLSILKATHPSKLRGEYLNLEPYSRYTLDCKPFGLIPIDSTLISKADTIYLEIKVDCVTGIGQLTIYVLDGAEHKTISIHAAQIGVNIQLSQIARDYLGTASAAASAVGNVVSNAMSLNIGGVISSAASGIESTIKAAAPQMMTSGANGSLLAFEGAPVLLSRFYIPVAEDNEHLGRPLCQTRTISTLPGYIMVMGCDIELPATLGEIQTVRGYMEAGFFYE